MIFKYWIPTITALSVALAMAAITMAVRAEEAADAPQSAWDKCIDTLENMPDYWSGWRRDFHNGYADSFEFYNSDGEYDSPAVLVTDFTIDDTAYETITSCFEGGKLSYVKTVMRSANTVGEAGTQAERHGEIYLDANGKVTKTLGWLENGGLDDKMKPITFPLSDPGYQLTRDCRPVALYKTTDDVQKALDETLGDIDGKRPDFTPKSYDWCPAAVAP